MTPAAYLSSRLCGWLLE